VFANSVFESEGYSNDHWTLSITIFTSLFLVANNKIMLTTMYFHPLYVLAIAGSFLIYFVYVWVTDGWMDIVMQHFTFYRLFSSPLFYITVTLPVLICFYIDLLIQAVIVLLLTDPQNLIRINLSKIKAQGEVDDQFLEQFKSLTEIQERFLVIDNYFKEEQLELLRIQMIQIKMMDSG